MKIVIPLAGLNPHTHSTSKPLMEVAGKPILEYILEDALKLNPSEIIFVVGYIRESIEEYIEKFYSHINCRFIEQNIKNGDGSAVRIALEDISEDEELLVLFTDTLIDFDIKEKLAEVKDDAVIFGMRVENPQHYGIMNIKDNLEIYEVEEKPSSPKSDVAIIGTYYFKSSMLVKKILDEFHNKMQTIKGEFKIIQVVERYTKMMDISIRTSLVKKWFDCGRVEVLLDANKYFLEKNSKSQEPVLRGSCVILPPSYVSKNAKLENCVIGPYASIGDECDISDSVIKNSIVGFRSKIENSILKKSLINKDVVLHGKPTRINIGEKSEMYLE